MTSINFPVVVIPVTTVTMAFATRQHTHHILFTYCFDSSFWFKISRYTTFNSLQLVTSFHSLSVWVIFSMIPVILNLG